MNETLFFLNAHPVTLTQVLLAAIGALLVGFVLVIASLRGQGRARAQEAERASFQAQELEERMAEVTRIQAELAGRLHNLNETVGSRQSDLSRQINERLDGLGHRFGQSLEGQTRATLDNLGKLNERLAVIDSAQKNLALLARDMVTLKDVLANKQARGAFGQGRMEAILADALPSSAYDLQHTLTNGKRPDAVIRLPGDTRVLVIDAKFPLEAITFWREAKSPEDRRLGLTRVKTDMVKHITDIAERYFIPGETQDNALLFVPAESVYADLHEHFDEVIQRAYRARVVIVSPSLLMLAIQVIQGLLKDEKMREEARVIQTEVTHLLTDVTRLRDRVLNLQKHFGQANEDVAQILVSADKIVKRGGRIEALEFEDRASGAKDLLGPSLLQQAGE